MLDLGTLKIGVTVDDKEAKSRLTNINNTVKSTGEAFDKTGKKLALGVTAPLTALGASAGKVGIDFQKAMSEVAAISGATGEELEKLSDTAKAMGSSTQFSASQAAEALQYMALAGYDTEKSIATLPTVLNLAAAGGMELAYTSDLVTDAMSALGDSAGPVEGFADQLAKTSQKSNTSVSQLGEAILTVGGTAKTLAGGTTELNTALGILADNGIKGAEGGTALRNMILSLSAPTDKSAKLMNKLGLEAFDAQGNMRPLNETFQDLDQILSTMNTEDQTKVLSEIFNKVDLKSANALLANSGERFNELSGYISDSKGAAALMAETMNDNVKGSFTSLMSAAEGIGIALFEGVQEPLKNIIDKLVEYAQSIIPVIEENAELIAIIGGVAAAIAPTLIAIGKVATVLGSLMNPVGLVITALGALAASVTSLYLTNEEFATEVDAIWENIKSMFETVLNQIKGFIQAFVGLTQRIWDKYGEDITTCVSGMMKTLESIFKATFEILGGLLEMFTALMNGDTEKLKEATIKTMDAMWNGVKGLFNTAIDWMKNLIPTMVQIGKDMVTGLWNGWKAVYESMRTWIMDKCNGLITGIKNVFQIKSPSRVMKEIGKNIGEGMQLGIQDSGKGVASATKQLTNEVLDLVRYYTLEYENTMSKSQQKVYDSRKEAVQNYIADQKYYNMLSLEEEMDFYKGMVELAKGNGEEMTYWEKEMYRVRQEMRKEDIDNLKESNKKYRELYMQQVKDANDILTAESSEEIKAIQDQLDAMDAEDKQKAYDEKYKRYQDQIKKLEKQLSDATWEERDRLNTEIAAKQKEFDEWLIEEDRKKQRAELQAQIKAEQEALKQKLENNNKYAESHLKIVDEKLKKTIEMIQKGESTEVAITKAKQQVTSEMNQAMLADTKTLLADKEAAQTQSNQKTMAEAGKFANDFYTENYRIGASLANGIADGILNTKWRITKALGMLVDEMKVIFNDDLGMDIKDYAGTFATSSTSNQTVNVNTDTSRMEQLLTEVNNKLDRLPSSFRNEGRLGYMEG